MILLFGCYSPAFSETSRPAWLLCLKFLTLQLSNVLLPTLTGNKKHENVKLMPKPLFQHNCQQIKKQNEI